MSSGSDKMLSVRLEPEIEERLDNLARETGRTKNLLVQEAIERYLDDPEDVFLAERVLERLRRGEEKTHLAEEVEKKMSKTVD